MAKSEADKIKSEARNANTTISSKLKDAQDLFYEAKNNYDINVMEDREKLYIGTHEVDANVNSQKAPVDGRKKANNVVNVIYELIESQTDTTIPQPSVQTKIKELEYLNYTIEDCIKNTLNDSEIFRINDENERTTPVQGFSIIAVDWNPEYKNHLYKGRIELDNLHPTALIPQPGVYDLQKMEYFFIMKRVTKEHIKKRFGVTIRDEGDEFPDFDTLSGESDNRDDYSNTLTMVTKWYKDSNNNIGKYTWANDEPLENLPDYFARRIDGKIEDEEELDEDIVKTNGTVIPQFTEERDDLGNVKLDKNGFPVKNKTKIKYYKPKKYPFVIRKNVPIPFNFGGQSDVDVIRDQADAIKKVISIIEEKIIRGGVIIKALQDHKFNLTNKLYDVVRGEMPELSALGVMDLQANIQQDLQFVAQQYQSAQNTLGITDSFQGKPDKTATSGLAKQIQIQQTSGRMQSKLFNKYNSFKELFEIMFEFKLAFYDEKRPYSKLNFENKVQYGAFNKYDFVFRDIAGEWYWETDFIFSADAGQGIPKDKMWLMNQANIFVQQGLLSKVQFWSIMEQLGYPGAREVKIQAEQEQQMQAQQQAQMQQMMEQQQQADFQKEAQEQRMEQEKLKLDARKQSLEEHKTIEEQHEKIEQGNFDRQLETAKLLQGGGANNGF